MHETTTKRPGRAGKYIRRALLALAAVILAAVLVLLALFQAELRTLNTIERVDDTDLFTMTYLGDYGLDDFLAQGGASNDNELLDFLMQKLLKGLPLRFDIPDLGCSTFAAETPEGDAIFGRNFDMYYSPALFVRTAPEDGYRSISMVNLSYIGFGEDKLPTSLLDSLLTLAAPYVPLDGLNEKGLAVGVLLIDTEPTDQQTDKPDITTTTAIRLLLDRAATVDEALALLRQYDMHASANSCYHFQIADAAGRAVVVEYIGDEMNVVESPRATNFLLTEARIASPSWRRPWRPAAACSPRRRAWPCSRRSASSPSPARTAPPSGPASTTRCGALWTSPWPWTMTASITSPLTNNRHRPAAYAAGLCFLFYRIPQTSKLERPTRRNSTPWKWGSSRAASSAPL